MLGMVDCMHPSAGAALAMAWWNNKSEVAQDAETVAGTPLGERRQTRAMAGSDVIRILRECCTQSLPAVIMCNESGVHCQARFASMSYESLIFCLYNDPGELAFSPLSLCCVSFNQGHRAHVFIAAVLEYRG